MPLYKTEFPKKPENISYSDWLRSKNVGMVSKISCNEQGIPTEFLSRHKPPPELFELNRERQGKILSPEDI